MSAHTPGPWTVLQPNKRFQDHPDMLLVVSKDADIAHVFQNTWDDTAQADAKLLAAAPDLLSALMLLLDTASLVAGQSSMGHLLTKDMDRARAALAKAGL